MEPNGRQVKLHPKSNTARALVFAILSILFSGCTLPTFEERAIDQGKVKGLVKRSIVPNRVAPKTTDSQAQITPEPTVESINVTAESDALRTFIRENLDQGLFSEKDNPRYRRAK